MKEIFLITLSSLLLLGCVPKKKEKEAYSFDLKLSETRDLTWLELAGIIELAALQGHPELLINGTYIYLLPVQPYGSGTKEIPQMPAKLKIEGMRDYDEKDSYRSSVNRFDLNQLKSWAKDKDLEAVRVSASKNVSMTSILSVIDLLNEKRIHIKLMSGTLGEDSIMEFTECVIRPLPIKEEIVTD